jgi:spore coat polysaccharide biosynthesis protein SpsF (cytidylyltransferase family)
MNSSRLPGKILAAVEGQPVLQRVFIRTSRAASTTETIFVMTTNPSGDRVAEYRDFSGTPFRPGNYYEVPDRLLLTDS